MAASEITNGTVEVTRDCTSKGVKPTQKQFIKIADLHFSCANNCTTAIQHQSIDLCIVYRPITVG